MISRQKTIALFLLTFVAILIFVLAMEASQLVLTEGTPMNLADQTEVGRGLGLEPQVGEALLNLIRNLLTCTFILLPLALFYMLFTKRGRRDLVLVLINAALMFLMFYAFSRIIPKEADAPTPTPGGEVQAPVIGVNLPTQEGGEVFVANPPEWAVWIGSLVLALLFALVVIVAYVRFFRRQQETQMFEDLAEEAQQAIDDIQAGGDLRQIIINCYRDMMRVVKKSRGIIRDEAMTPEEFQQLLIKKGLPGGPLERLTQLFEAVRYGNHQPKQHEDQLAILCLQELVAACQREERAT